ncbi:MAG TPA: DUF4352 domain-containing protein [Candidatus Nitrosocosmicus sp.]|nr:DUF4352 domain-containing protein [Candidatus Nitrosocosmicus sp.]
MKKNIFIAVGGLIIFSIGFVSGMEYKASQVRSAINKAFTPNVAQDNSKNNTVLQQAKKEDLKIINKAVGDEIVLATLKYKVNEVKETQTITSTYSSPKVANEGAKFIVINLDITNTTNSSFSFPPDEVFVVVDDKEREYRTYANSIGNIDEYLNYKDLTPSVKVTGNLVYEVPQDTERYSIFAAKAGTKEMYKVILK